MSVCEYNSQLGPYLDGELDVGSRNALEGHIPQCAECDSELRELRSLSQILTADNVPGLSSRALGRLHGRISELEDDREQAERAARRILRITRVLTGIAACLLVAGSLWLSLARQQAPTDPPTKLAEAPSTAAPWEIPAQPTAETPASSSGDGSSPADATANWMVGGLVSSAPVTPSLSAGEEEP